MIGYSGRAGREYFQATNSVEIEVGDAIRFCKAVENFAFKDDTLLSEQTLKGSQFVRATYSRQRECESLLMAMNRFL